MTAKELEIMAVVPKKVREVYGVISDLPDELQQTVVCGLVEELAFKNHTTAKEMFRFFGDIAEAIEDEQGPYEGGIL